jgi:hypothetical protein
VFEAAAIVKVISQVADVDAPVFRFDNEVRMIDMVNDFECGLVAHF